MSGSNDEDAAREAARAEREAYVRGKDIRTTTASLLSRFSKKELQFSGEPGVGVTLRQFANDAALLGNLSIATTEGLDIGLSTQYDLMMSGWLTHRAKLWWDQNKTAYDNKTWAQVIQDLIDAFVDPLEKQILSREFAKFSQKAAEEMVDYIARMHDLLARAVQVEFETTPDVVWMVFSAGLNSRFTHAASVLDLVSNGQDKWPEGAERLRRWEMANPAPKNNPGSEAAKNASVSNHNNNNNGGNKNSNNIRSNSNRPNRWVKKKHDEAQSSSASAPLASSEAHDPRHAGKTCYHCRKVGHLAWGCPDKNKPAV